MVKYPSKKELDEVRKKLDKGEASFVLPPDANPVDKTKYEMCKKFVVYKAKKNLTQKELAERIGIDQALVSKILHYQIAEFTTDRLIRYLSKIFKEVEVRVDVA